MVTLADVAHLAGVSTASASLVLSGHHRGRVSESTAERVRAAAEELGYVRDALAGGLRSRMTQTIGVIADEVLSTPYASNLMATVITVAREVGWSLLVTDVATDPGGADRAARELVSRRVDRVVYVAMFHHEVHVPARLGTGVMVVNGYADRLGVLGLVPDEAQGAHDAVQHLIDLGHRRIAHLTVGPGSDVPVAGPLRSDSYRATLRSNGIEPDASLLLRGGTNPDEADRMARRLLDRADRPTAVFCFNDGIAAGVYRQAAELGLSIPKDLSVVGFDNQLLIATNTAPRLTTVRLPHEEMAEWAVRRLIEPVDRSTALAGGTEPGAVRRFLCPLVERSSCAPPAAV